MALAHRPPPCTARVVLAPKPARVVQVIKLNRNSYFGIHCPVDARQTTDEAVTEASVLAFSHRGDAFCVAGWLANHRRLAKLWPSRLVDLEVGLNINAGELLRPVAGKLAARQHGLSVEEEPFTLFLRALSLEGIAMRLITDIDSHGKLSTTMFKEKTDQKAVQQHFEALLSKKSNKM